MAKNSKGGNKNRRRGRKFSKPQSRDLKVKSTDQEYGKLEKALGNSRFECRCSDGIVRTAFVPGSFKFRYWMRVDDVVLVSIRIGLNTSQCDILYKYNPTEVQQLHEKELLKNVFVDENATPIEEALEEVTETTENILEDIDSDILDDI